MRATLFKLTFGFGTFAALCFWQAGQARADGTPKPTPTKAAATMPAATMPATTAPVVIKWEEAARHVGQTVTITGPVKGTHVTGNKEALILNIGKDYPDPARFTVMIATDDKHPAKEADYKDKTVTVTGKVEIYRKVPEIKIAKAGDVVVAKE